MAARACSQRMAVAAALALFVAVLSGPLDTAVAQGAAEAGDPAGPSIEDQDLAEMYAPVLYFHPDEVYRPQPVDVMIRIARLQRTRRFWPDTRLLRRVTTADLARYSDPSHCLDAWLGSEIASDYQNYTAHRDFYESLLSPEAFGPSPLAYAHVVRDEGARQITVQYWLFYWYNDAFNKHEGDWEMMQVVLTAAGEPQWVVLSQHHGGTRRPWSAAPIEEGTHPAVYVALGSHANYFSGNEIYISGISIGNAHVEVADRTGTAGRTVPAVTVIPDRERIEANPAAWAGLEWLLFRGRWGEQASQGDFSGPVGPADKGEQWEHPGAWGMAQPLDTDAWYANRLRVEVLGQTGESANVTLRAAIADRLPAAGSGGGAVRTAALDRPAVGSAAGTLRAAAYQLPAAEALGPMALLHTDPITGTDILAGIEAPPHRRYDIVATWPDAATGQVVAYRFDDVPLGPEGRATITLRANEPPVLRVAEQKLVIEGTVVERRRAIWDAPDLVWVMGHLPAFDVVRGVLVSLLAGLIPALAYLAVLYWADQYEKEPVRLLAAAFAWGALPALLVAVALQLFFPVPGGVLEARSVEMMSTGLVAPLIETALIGAAVLFIAWRHRREFDGVLDGVIYGAVAGLGFALTANTLTYLMAFLQYGFGGLGRTIWIDGMLYGLNHALYAAILGAGLGYARAAPRRWQRWAVPLGAFILAVAIHAFHNLAIDSTMGWNVATLVVTWIGLLVIIGVMVWSVREQRQCLVAELAGEVPEAIYRWLSIPAGGWLAEWRALWRGGPRALLQVRHVFQLCAKLAFKKMAGRQPDEPAAAAEVGKLREKLQPLMTGELQSLVS